MDLDPEDNMDWSEEGRGLLILVGIHNVKGERGITAGGCWECGIVEMDCKSKP
jgi:hypothetical protein